MGEKLFTEETLEKAIDGAWANSRAETLKEVNEIIDEIGTPTHNIVTKELMGHILPAEELKKRLGLE